MFTLPGYDIVEAVHESSSRHVFRAFRQDGLPVILKVLRAEHPEPAEIAWFRREYEMLRALDLPGVVKAYGLENPGWSWALVLEDFGGLSLEKLILFRTWTLTEQLRVAIAAAEALGQLHARSVIHKDLSPGNLAWNPDTGVLKIIDLGSATVLSRETPSVRDPSGLQGTLPYLSPEQTGRVNRAVDHRTDFYSLGATLYELFTGTPPFSGTEPMELVHCHIARQPVEPWEHNPGVPRAVSDILMRLLAKTPDARYQSSFGLKADLEQCLSHWESTGSISPFPLARHDVPEHFRIPQALYGREQELAVLLSAFERTASGGADGRAAMALVTGYSGVGKSTLVHELYKPITQRRGYFIAGKFEQFQRSTPYSAVVGAFQSLVRQLLTESEAALVEWRRKLLEVLGVNGRVVIDVLPELELILGPQPPLAQLGPMETQNRFHLTFGDFIRAFAQPSHPLVIFLDDLQWTDFASLKLIEQLLTDERPQCLFVIGAYRDYEIGPAHPLLTTLDILAKAGVRPRHITLAPLGPTDVTQLVADTVGRPPAEVGQLTRLVGQKTEGNPLFVTELLKSLYEDGLLDFDRTQGRWQWDVARIAARGLADNVVDLVLGKLRRLPASTQHAVRLAACVGSSFDLDTLAVVLETSPSEAFEHLLPAIQEGFLAAISGLVVADPCAADSAFIVRDLKFLHDRVQQAAYNLIGEDERKGVHLRIGRLLLAGSALEPRGNALFQIIDQLNRGRSLISDAAELDRLARLNLEAGRQARRALAYASAITYVEAGIGCLSESSWAEAYELSFALGTELADVTFLNGELERSEVLSRQLIERARTSHEKSDLHLTLVSQYTMRTRYQEALTAAKDGLALLGVELPLGLAAEQLQSLMLSELAQVQAQLGSRPIASLSDDPEMTDPTARRITSLLQKILPASLFACSPVHYSLMVFKGMGLLLRFGPSSQAADLFSNYGIIVSSALGDHHSGYEFGRLAISLMERFNRPDGKCRSAFFLANFIAPWSRPLHETDTINERAYRAGLEGGDIIYTGYVLPHKAQCKFLAGRPLEEVAADLQDYLHFCRRTRNEVAKDGCMSVSMIVDNLRGMTASASEFRHQELDEPALLAMLEANSSTMSLCNYWIHKAGILFLQEDPRGALELCAKAEPLMPVLVGCFTIPVHALYQALGLAALWPEASPEEQARYRVKLDALAARWNQWAASSPNLVHLALLVSAEIARLDGQASRALELYEQAIEGARQGGFTHHVALAAELAAKFWLGRGRKRAAAVYLREARHAYRLWGAVRKVESLESRYAELLGLEEVKRTSTSGSSQPGSKSSSKSSSEGRNAALHMDLSSVLKASQAISSELVLDRLLTHLMHIVLENAGGRKGALVFEKNGELVVQVDAGIEKHGAQETIIGVLQSTPLSDYPDASEEIIRYVARTRTSVILSDAAREGGFTRSAYVVRREPKSILCVPLMSRGQLLAVVYLENNLTTGAFTPERLEVLRILSSQIAISLENALLYREIEQRVTERTAELQKKNVELQEAIEDLRTTQRQLVQSEKMASLGRLTMGIAHEIKNPLNFVNNFAKLDVRMLAELEELLGQGSAMPMAEVRDILQDLKVNSEKICEHGERADKIVRSMLRHTGGGTGERRKVELNTLVDDFVRLAWHGARVEPSSSVQVQIEHEYDSAAGQVTVVPQDLGRVLVNLVSNALDAVREKQRQGGAYVPTIRVSTRKLGNAVAIQVHDNGPGVPAQIRDRLFEPFFTTKPPGAGTGLGLSLSYDIVVGGHGGTLTFESQEGQGALFQVTLPV